MCDLTWAGENCEEDLCSLRDDMYVMALSDSHYDRDITNYTEWRDILHPKVFKEYAVLSAVVIGITALVTCIAFGVLRAKRKDLVTSYMMEEDQENELVSLSDVDGLEISSSSSSGSGEKLD